MKRPFTWIIAVFIIAEVTFSQTDYSVIETSVPLSIGEVSAIYPVSRTPSDVSRVHYVLHGEDQVYFVDEAFNPLDSMTVQPGWRTGILASHNHRFFLVEETLFAEDLYSTRERAVTLVDYTGKVYYRKTESYRADDIHIRLFQLSGIDGTLYELDAYDSRLRLWNNDDSLAREIELFDEPSYVRMGRIALTEDDQHIIVLKQRLGGVDGGEPHLFIFDKEGNLIREKILEYDISNEVHVKDSDHGIICLLADYENITTDYASVVYDFNLQKLYEIERIAPMLVRYINDYLYIIHGKNRILYLSKYNRYNGVNIWNYAIQDFTIGSANRVDDISFMDSEGKYVGFHMLKRDNPVVAGRIPGDREKDVYVLQIVSNENIGTVREIELGRSKPAFEMRDDRTYGSSISVDVNKNIRKLAVEEK